MSARRASRFEGAVLALSGGIGGAKLALGLDRVLPPGKLVVVANTGDDFEHLGFSISPDLDTLMYTLAGLNNEELGWGRRGETWAFMSALEKLGGETWFRLGDGDLATHAERTRRLGAGATLTEVTAELSRRLGIAARLLPMSDDRVRTRLRSEQGWLDFQDYFVRRRCEPVVREIVFDGIDHAKPQPDFLAALRDPGLRAVLLCPSNPFISIEPILDLPGVRDALAACPAPVVAVSPIIGGRAVKGPTAKMMRELGLATSAAAVSRRYKGLLDAVILDEVDARDSADHGAEIFAARTLMTTLEDKMALARRALEVADAVAENRRGEGLRRAR
ncbi:MAG TPA: 2-phospho-L-lactate transferase [Stellaceae bacterium]|nr:2-phospho-L-lactate transferase [Stellaceae bacterium]